ncbi:MAG: MBL fold metallo-hydrolase [Planctomycetes bacterium]|nr:MBL fold metallo-hydrolase [Planctomycetota bacterium]MCH8118696.1 MBL fold metallo-hydrolase [Planctomycetota bacterium]
MPSHNLAHIKIDDLEIIGYSVAGEETVVAVPQLDVCFDVGKAPDQIIPINNILLTHGHMDHAAGIAYYLSQRNFCGISTGTILAPKNLLPPMKEIINAWSRLDGNKIPANLVGVKPGDEYRIKPNLFTRVFPTKHSRGSVGYTVIEKRKKLKTEYKGLTGPQIVELKKQGVEIDYPLEIPIVTYLGDTQYVDFSQLKYIAESKILIAECTFYEGEHSDRAEAGRHMHIDEFATLLDKMKNEHIIITHITQRTPMREIRKILKDALPKDKYDRITLLMAKRPNLR